MALNIVILAAGKGKRMHSSLPKVLHPIGGKPLLEHVVNTATSLGGKTTVVYGFGGEQVRKTLAHLDVQWVEQSAYLGTGHAVLQVLPYLEDNSQVLILVGDCPLVSQNTLTQLIQTTSNEGLGLVTAIFEDPKGFGRILRNNSQLILGIVEDKDASQEQKRINEINTGIIIAPAKKLKQWLPKLKNHNAQEEYYLTDIFSYAVNERLPINSILANPSEEVLGINDRVQLARLERLFQKRQAEKLMYSGVTLIDPERLNIRGQVDIAQDVIIDVNVILEGEVKIGSHCYIGANCILKDVEIAEAVEILPNSIIEGAVIESHCKIGPFARIRPGTHLKTKARIGNFVEVKKSELGEGSKANHLTYIGDAIIGRDCNIGAGTITCNYDGFNKHITKIGDRVQVGSDTTLVAPINIHDDAYIATATTIRNDVPEGSLVFNPRSEEIKEGWTATKRAKEKEAKKLKE